MNIYSIKKMVEIEDRNSALEQQTSICEVAHQQFEEWSADGGQQRKKHLGACWEVATDIIEAVIDPEDNDAVKFRISEMMVDVFNGQNEEFNLFIDQDDNFAGVAFKDPSASLRVLEDMGLEAIECIFEMGSKRGNPKDHSHNLVSSFRGWIWQVIRHTPSKIRCDIQFKGQFCQGHWLITGP